MKILWKNIELKLNNLRTRETNLEQIANLLTPALRAVKKQSKIMKFQIFLLLLLLLIKDQDHSLVLDHYLAQDQDLILFLYPNLDLVQDHFQVLDQDQGQNLCHGIIAEENGSRMLSITELAAGS